MFDFLVDVWSPKFLSEHGARFLLQRKQREAYSSNFLARLFSQATTRIFSPLRPEIQQEFFVLINTATNRVARSDRRLPDNLVISFARQSPCRWA